MARHAQNSVPRREGEAYEGDAYLGIDSGSTTLKVVLTDADGSIIFSKYQSNQGKPIDVVKNTLIEMYEKYPDDEILNISMAAGLSGTYDSAVAAVKLVDNGDKITVLNSRTLCGPHRYMVEKAVEWANEGLSVPAILEKLEERMQTEKSFLLPADFDYLRRGGRLSPLVSYVGVAANLVPVMTLTEDCKQLTVATIRRSFSQAVKHVITFSFVGLEVITGVILAVLLVFLNVEKDISKKQAEIAARREK